MPSTSRPVRLALAGVQGFGRVHLATIARLGDRVQLVAAADPVPPPEGALPDGAEWFADLVDLLDCTSDLDVVIVATPIASHAALAIAAMEAGADVYVEKPTAASLESFDSMLEASARTGRSVQVGFQSLGSLALRALLDGTVPGVGEIRSAAGYGAWQRHRSYWTRSPWAGRRTLDGRDVMDGVVTNPLAHAVATALAVVGARRVDAVLSVEADLYRANDIEADDLSVVRARTADGRVASAALTLDATEETLPFVTVRGSLGIARFWYTEDVVERADGSRLEFGRTDLLENLLDHRENGAALLSSLEDSGAFMRVLEQVGRTEPAPIAPDFVEWVGDGPGAHPVVRDVEHWLAVAADQFATFSELGAPWARPREDRVVAEITLDGGGGAKYLDGRSITATSSPRPYLHPMTTPGGIVVTDHHPADHDWHFGLSVALQDVDGSNFWGGRTYVRDRGYAWRDDHGRIESREPRVHGTRLTDTREWIGPDAQLQLIERLEFQAQPEDDGWLFHLAFELAAPADDPVSIGSPGSNGRTGGGYGGLAWRIAPCRDIRVRTPEGTGEVAVHGSRSEWIAWTARFATGEATIALAPADDATARDPWFVRVEAYPGLSSALAWDERLVIEPGAPARRAFRGLVADGALDDSAVAALLAAS